jgi:hypothetical protein
MTKEIIRVTCPCCGMMTDLEQIARADAEKPAEVRLFVQKLGGKKPAETSPEAPYHKKGRGKAPGYIEYQDITESSPEQVAKLRDWFEARAKQFLKS